MLGSGPLLATMMTALGSFLPGINVVRPDYTLAEPNSELP
jgi:hypothetical protein